MTEHSFQYSKICSMWKIPKLSFFKKNSQNASDQSTFYSLPNNAMCNHSSQQSPQTALREPYYVMSWIEQEQETLLNQRSQYNEKTVCFCLYLFCSRLSWSFPPVSHQLFSLYFVLSLPSSFLAHIVSIPFPLVLSQSLSWLPCLLVWFWLPWQCFLLLLDNSDG